MTSNGRSFTESARDIFIELPPEDPQSKCGQTLGKLQKTLHGTRDAPLCWQKVVKKLMLKNRFRANTMSPGVFWHPDRDLKIITHVDDFLIAGEKVERVWFETQVRKDFEVTVEKAGWGAKDKKQIKFLGRLISFTSCGVEVEDDVKHVQMLMEEYNMLDCKGVETPGVNHEVNEEREEMSSSAATVFRRCAARLVYMAQDRGDLSFAAKNAAQRMAKPKVGDDLVIKRAVRYLKAYPRMALTFKFQEKPKCLRVYVDADWANDVDSRRSTSGGTIKLGENTIAWWSKGQSRIAL